MANSNATVGVPARPGLQLPLLFGLLVLMIGISVVTLAIYDRYRYQPMLTVDVEKIMQQKMDQLQQQTDQIEQDEMVRLSKLWAQQLATEMTRLKTEYNAVVLVRPAVIEGAMDMTQQVMNTMSGGQ